MLNEFGYRNDTACNGEEAIAMVVSRQKENCCQYKVIIMDCHMPKMNGYEATKTLKNLIKERKISDTIIIACSADISKANHKKCLESGCELLIGKPIEKLFLQNFLNNHL